MMQRHSHWNRRSNQRARRFSHPFCHRFRSDCICADQSSWAVLLMGTDGENDATRSRQIRLNLWPGRQLQQHIHSPAIIDNNIIKDCIYSDNIICHQPPQQIELGTLPPVAPITTMLQQKLYQLSRQGQPVSLYLSDQQRWIHQATIVAIESNLVTLHYQLDHPQDETTPSRWEELIRLESIGSVSRQLPTIAQITGDRTPTPQHLPTNLSPEHQILPTPCPPVRA